MAAFTSSCKFSMRASASGVSSCSSCLMYPVRSIRNFNSSAVDAGSPGARNPSTRSSSLATALSSAPPSSASGANSVASAASNSAGEKSMSCCKSSSASATRTVSAAVGSAVSLTRSRKVPRCIARASSISSLKPCSAVKARKGRSFRRSTSLIAPHMEVPVSSAMFSMASRVFLPMPRVGVLITRCTAMESSGFWMTFRYEIKSLISARS